VQLGCEKMSADWTSASYFWAVICGNVKVHKNENVMVGHKIPLAETDAFEALPVTGSVPVKCDESGEEYIYEPSEVVRLGMGAPDNFTTGPRFL
jgi:hypothetical protein